MIVLISFQQFLDNGCYPYKGMLLYTGDGSVGTYFGKDDEGNHLVQLPAKGGASLTGIPFSRKEYSVQISIPIKHLITYGEY